LDSANQFAKVSHGSSGFDWKHKATVPMEALLWFLLEAAVALGLLILIVWWTLPRKPRRSDRNDTPQ